MVEDNADDAALVLQELRRAGFDPVARRVDTADAMREALARDPWDIVISDYTMPAFSGTDAIRVLQASGRELPFILVSGTVGEETAVEAMKAGASDYVLKDNLPRLAPAVAREVHEAEIRRRHREAERAAEEALGNQQRFLRTVIDTTPHLVFVKDWDGRFTLVNKAVADIYGTTAENLVGKTDADFNSNPDEVRQFLEHDRDVMSAGRSKLIPEERVTDARTGQPRWFQTIKVPLNSAHGATRQVLGVSTDITERKRAEDQVLRQLEALTALFSGAQKLTQSLDLQTLASDVTRSVVEVFGATLAWIGQAQPDGRVRMLAMSPAQEDASLDQIEVRWDESPRGQGTAGRAIRSGFPVIVPDSASDPNMGPWREFLLALGIRGVASFPLTRRDRPFGALAVCSDQVDFFTPERVELFQAYANQAAAALENARLFAETERRLQHLGALRAIDLAITGSLDLRVTLNVLLDQVTSQLQVDAAAVLLLDPHTQTIEYTAGRGFRGNGITRSRLPLGGGHAGRAAHTQRIVSIANLQEAGESFLRAGLIAGEKFVGYAAAPLLAKGQVKGVLEVFHRGPLEFDSEWMQFLEALAGQAAIAIDSAALVNDLQQANVDLTLAYDTTLEGWSRALDLRDKETEGHTQRVTEFTMQLARAMGVPEEEVPHIRRGALLHDIGKMGIPDSILLKPGPLTPEEWEIMRRHPVYANQLLMPIPYLRRALDIPFYHHEKWDGTGYPQGLQGHQIPLAARIFAVADVWDALTSDRPYRPAWTREKAIAHIREQAGKHFDPQVVSAFLRLVESAA